MRTIIPSRRHPHRHRSAWCDLSRCHRLPCSAPQCTHARGRACAASGPTDLHYARRQSDARRPSRRDVRAPTGIRRCGSHRLHAATLRRFQACWDRGSARIGRSSAIRPTPVFCASFSIGTVSRPAGGPVSKKPGGEASGMCSASSSWGWRVSAGANGFPPLEPR